MDKSPESVLQLKNVTVDHFRIDFITGGIKLSKELGKGGSGKAILYKEMLRVQTNLDKTKQELRIDYVKREKMNKLTRKKICLKLNEDSCLIADSIENELLKVSGDRPKNLLVFVNPYGGKQVFSVTPFYFVCIKL